MRAERQGAEAVRALASGDLRQLLRIDGDLRVERGYVRPEDESPVEPVEGVETMRERRGEMKDRNLTSGPGKLCFVFDIDRSFNGEDLRGDKIWLEKHRSFSDEQIAVGRRIGIDYAGEDAQLPLRFWVKDNIFVSKLS